MANATQTGYGEEVTYGTEVTVDTFAPTLSIGGAGYDRETIVSDAVRGGRFLRSPGDEAWGNETVAFDVAHELYQDGAGLLFKHILGGDVATTGAGPYEHVITPASHFGNALTVQLGADRTDGTVDAYTMAGCKPVTAEVRLAQGENAQIGVSFAGQSFTDATALATATYPTTQPYSFVDGTITYNSVSQCIQSIALSFDNALKVDRRCIGSGQVKEPVALGYRTYTGTLEAEYDDKTFVDAWLAGSVFTLDLTLSNGTKSCKIEGETKLRGGLPAFNLTDVTSQNIPFEFLSDTDDDTAMTITYTSDDVTI